MNTDSTDDELPKLDVFTFCHKFLTFVFPPESTATDWRRETQHLDLRGNSQKPPYLLSFAFSPCLRASVVDVSLVGLCHAALICANQSNQRSSAVGGLLRKMSICRRSGAGHSR